MARKKAMPWTEKLFWASNGILVTVVWILPVGKGLGMAAVCLATIALIVQFIAGAMHDEIAKVRKNNEKVVADAQRKKNSARFAEKQKRLRALGYEGVPEDNKRRNLEVLRMFPPQSDD
jgi:hypothetical protein